MISSRPITSFHPRLTKAECEFWFEAGADWQDQTEQRVEGRLARAFPDVADVTEPFLWFEPNYLAVLSAPTGGASAHADVKAHAGCITRALAAYQGATKPRRVQTLFLNYQFEFDSGVLPRGPRKTVWNTPREMMTLEREAARSGSQARLAIRCLITHPSALSLSHPSRWLEGIHGRMEGAFHKMQTAPC